MFIWRRRGMLVFLAMALGILTIGLIGAVVYPKSELELSPQELGKLIKFTFWIPALWNFILTRLFTKDEKVTVMTGENGVKHAFNNYSSFFFIRNKYWTFILLALGIMTAVFG